MRRTAGIATVLVALFASTGAASAAVHRASMATLEQQLMCVTCGIPLELAVSPQADRERANIQRLINQGLTDAQIKQALVAQLGPDVLALPPRRGFDLAVYVVPVVVIVLLLGILAIGLRRWRGRERPDPPAVAGPGLALSEASRLDEDLARFNA